MELCTDCGTCVEACPIDAIWIQNVLMAMARQHYELVKRR